MPQHTKPDLRLLSVEHEVGMEIQTTQGWGVFSLNTLREPAIVSIVEDRDGNIYTDKATVIPWHRVVRVIDHGEIP